MIVVEGPPAVGKTEIAKKIAEELEMVYFPRVTMDAYYINNYGYDLRKLDDQLPPSVRSFDEKDFFKVNWTTCSSRVLGFRQLTIN